MGPKQDQNGIRIEASTLKALRKPLEASWNALGALLEASGGILKALGGSQERSGLGDVGGRRGKKDAARTLGPAERAGLL